MLKVRRPYLERHAAKLRLRLPIDIWPTKIDGLDVGRRGS